MLFALRELVPISAWNEELLSFAFWTINGGLVMMLGFGLIPNGFYQLIASVNHGTWYARSAKVIGSPWMHWTVWLRIPGDIVFALGALAMVIFTLQAIVAIFRRPALVKMPELAASEP